MKKLVLSIILAMVVPSLCAAELIDNSTTTQQVDIPMSEVIQKAKPMNKDCENAYKHALNMYSYGILCEKMADNVFTLDNNKDVINFLEKSEKACKGVNPNSLNKVLTEFRQNNPELETLVNTKDTNKVKSYCQIKGREIQKFLDGISQHTLK